MPSRPFIVPALICALAATACTTVTPGGLVAASRLDPLNTPFDQIGVAVGVPVNVRMKAGDATMQIALRTGDAASDTVVEETVRLVLEHDAAGTVRETAADERVYLATLDPDDADRFAQAQADIRAARARGIKGTGSLSVSITDGCYVGERPETFLTRTWIRMSPDDAFVPLTRRTEVSRLVGSAKGDALTGRLARC